MRHAPEEKTENRVWTLPFERTPSFSDDNIFPRNTDGSICLFVAFFTENCQKMERMNLILPVISQFSVKTKDLPLERYLGKVKWLLEDMTYLQMVGEEEQERLNDKAVEMENQVERNKGIFLLFDCLVCQSSR